MCGRELSSLNQKLVYVCAPEYLNCSWHLYKLKLQASPNIVACVQRLHHITKRADDYDLYRPVSMQAFLQVGMRDSWDIGIWQTATSWNRCRPSLCAFSRGLTEQKLKYLPLLHSKACPLYLSALSFAMLFVSPKDFHAKSLGFGKVSDLKQRCSSKMYASHCVRLDMCPLTCSSELI